MTVIRFGLVVLAVLVLVAVVQQQRVEHRRVVVQERQIRSLQRTLSGALEQLDDQASQIALIDTRTTP